MTFLLGVILILGILLWRADSSLEWSIPLKWQDSIRSWKEGLGNKTHTLKYIWYLGQGNSELEKHLWHLQMALPRLRKKFRLPLWIEVGVHHGSPPGQKERYISCLQRRFPGIEIDECPLCERSGEEGEI